MAALWPRRLLLPAALRLGGRRRGSAAALGPPGSGSGSGSGARPCSGGGGGGGVLRHLLLKLRATGPLTVAEYMREALTNPGQVRRGRGSASPPGSGSGPGAGPLTASPRRATTRGEAASAGTS